MEKAWSSQVLLLGLGAQKTGTSWFASYLQSHPEIFMSPLKEMHFFKYNNAGGNWPNSYFQKQLIRQLEGQQKKRRINNLEERLRMGDDVDKYKEFFRSRMGDLQHACEITPAYSKLPVSELRKIQNNFDRVKPFFFLRNPADRYWSQLKFSNPTLNLKEIEFELNKTFTDHKYLSRSDYKSSLSSFGKVFDHDSFFREFYENLFTEQAVRRFCEFAEVSFHLPDFSKRRNVSTPLVLPDQLRANLVEHLREQYWFCSDYFGETLPNKWKADIQLFL